MEKNENKKPVAYQVIYDLRDDDEEKLNERLENDSQYEKPSNMTWLLATFASEEEAKQYIAKMEEFALFAEQNGQDLYDVYNLYNPKACHIEPVVIDNFNEKMKFEYETKKMVETKKHVD